MPASAAPLYFRIQETLRTEIMAGRSPPGFRLPSETELARTFATTRTTVRQALARLMSEGLIVRRMGSGTFVADRRIEGHIEAQRPQSFEEQMQVAGGQVSFKLLEFTGLPATAAMSAGLGLAEGDPVYRLLRLRLVDGEIIGLEDRQMVARVGTAIPAAALTSQSAVRMVENALGTALGGMDVAVGAVAANASVARLLGMRNGRPVLTRTHTFFDQDGRPVLSGEFVYRGDKYRFVYGFGRRHV